MTAHFLTWAHMEDISYGVQPYRRCLLTRSYTALFFGFCAADSTYYSETPWEWIKDIPQTGRGRAAPMNVHWMMPIYAEHRDGVLAITRTIAAVPYTLMTYYLSEHQTRIWYSDAAHPHLLEICENPGGCP